MTTSSAAASPAASAAGATTDRPTRILLVEDDATFAERLRRNLESEKYEVVVAGNGREALDRLRATYIDLVVSDIRMPGFDGSELLARIRGGRERDVDRDVPLVILTSVSDLRTAVEAMRLGAADYITKDSDKAELLLRVRRALERSRLLNENRLLKDQLERHARAEFGEIVGASEAAAALRREIALLGPTAATVLITGETGVGKELVARALHALGPNKGGPFVDANCAALPDENMFQSEVFGHEAGSFTGATGQRRGRFEMAHGGTLFLDEVGELNAAAQAKLLKAIESREFMRLGGSKPIKVSCRLVFATNRDLGAEVKAGRFRQDLFYRINVVPLHIAPLRERRDDVPLLAAFFCERFGREYGRGGLLLEPGCLEGLAAYDWPGNIRELRNIMERLVIRARGGSLGAADLANVGLANVGLAVRGGGAVGAQSGALATGGVPPGSGAGTGDGDSKDSSDSGSLYHIPDGGIDLEEVERRLVEAALVKADWNQKEAARLLGISHDRMNARVKKFGFRHPSWRRNK